MSLKDQIKSDSVTALKAHESNRVEVLRYLVSLIDKKELQLPPGEMKESEAINVLRKELKNKEESREMFKNAGRDDLVESLDYEIEIVKSYLPEDMNEEDIKAMVDGAVEKFGANFALVMREVMPQVQGRVGGDLVSRIVKEKLSEEK